MKKYAFLALCALGTFVGPLTSVRGQDPGPTLDEVRAASGDNTALIVSWDTVVDATASRRLLALTTICLETDWTNYGQCKLPFGKTCGNGLQEQRRTVRTGNHCTVVTRNQPCQGPPCLCQTWVPNPKNWIQGLQTGVTIGSKTPFTRGDCPLGFISTVTMSTCGDDLKWCAIPEPQCVPRPCLDVLWDPNANVTNGGRGCYGDTVTFSCCEGYALVMGPAQLTCGKRGAWTSAMGCVYPRCVKTDCPQFRAPPENGYFTYIESPVQTFTVKCFTGFHLSCDQNVFTCTGGSCHPLIELPKCLPDVINLTPARRLLSTINIGQADLQ